MIHPETDQPVAIVTTLCDEGDVINHRHMTDSVHKWGALAGVELCHAGGLSNNLSSRYVSPAAHQFATPWIPQVYTYEAEDSDLAAHRRACSRRRRSAPSMPASTSSMSTAPTARCRCRCCRAITTGAPTAMAATSRTARASGSRSSRRCGARRTANAPSRRAFPSTSSPDRPASRAADEGLRFVEHVTRLGLVDLWDVNISSLEEWGEDAGPSRFYKSNHQAPWTREVKRIAKVPVVGVGRFTDPDEMVRVLRSGQYDIIGCARPSIADPWLPRKIDEGRVDDIAECIGCNQCIARFEYGVPIVCTQNPTALEEYRRGWHPGTLRAARASDELILVVGAGPAGLECARVLGRRGYRAHLMRGGDDAGRASAPRRAAARSRRMVSRRRATARRSFAAWRMSRSCAARARRRRTIFSTYGAERRSCSRPARTGTATASARRPGSHRRASTSTLPGFVTPEQVFAGKAIGDEVVILDSDGYFMAVSLAELLADAGQAGHPRDALRPRGALYGFHARRPQPAPHDAREGHCRAYRPLGRTGGAGGQRRRRSPLYDVYRDGSQRTDTPAAGRAAAPRWHRPSKGFAATPSCSAPAAIPTTALYRDLAARRAEWAATGIDGRLSRRRLPGAALHRRRRLRRPSHGPRDRLLADPQRPRAIIRERRIWGEPAMQELEGTVL